MQVLGQQLVQKREEMLSHMHQRERDKGKMMMSLNGRWVGKINKALVSDVGQRSKATTEHFSSLP